ncbi:MAG: tRNA glutamyl-Q(34) synthetase GluQRS [Cellvibrionales bacterium]|nr:tRNA glutamyl-Q(34) synthetase GluQRS [Cellvibrionales bacterium]MBK8674858.1 tRNA glutamyl-Q(34) synthetase GluQRS [Cellvibrionales bacterium]HRF88585.1 tRNA glutamyl-Q(34) synthetase GluQRS [Pseudomonadales bacterium]
MSTRSLTGRFAPSPSGPLHFGSLLAAVASFVDARAAGGRWLLRMEDIDPPREMAGADKLILSTLEQHGLHWDGAVLYQSTRHARYREVLDDLLARGQIYRCACTRARLISLHRVYDGYCRQHPPPADAACALRLQLPEKSVVFDDRIQGVQVQHLAEAGDCIIHRKDGLFAYQLAVVVDDIDQGVTDIVRGSDILPSTGAQIHLTELLNGTTPRYAHVPVLLGADGHKLSKQSFAPAVDNRRASANLHYVLQQLKQNPPLDLAHEAPEVVLQWAVAHWDITQIATTAPARDTQ